jgi:hypothetical protein
MLEGHLRQLHSLDEVLLIRILNSQSAIFSTPIQSSLPKSDMNDKEALA